MRSAMSPRPMTLSDVNGLALDTDEAAQALHMTEEAFRAFYERTARPLWAYLARATGEPHTADDLLQDAYYRLLRSKVAFDDDDHRRNYLFRIATNLVRDRYRRPTREVALPDDEGARPLVARTRRRSICDQARRDARARRASAAGSRSVVAGLHARALACRDGADPGRQDRQREVAAVPGASTTCQSPSPFGLRQGKQGVCVMSRLAECRHEADLVGAVTSGRWPTAVDQALREHVASCPVCADVLQVAEVMTAIEQETLADTRLPSPGQVWWRAQLRARRRGRLRRGPAGDGGTSRRRRHGPRAGGGRHLVEMARDCACGWHLGGPAACVVRSEPGRMGRRRDGSRAGPAGNLRRRPGVGAGLRPVPSSPSPISLRARQASGRRSARGVH